MDVTTVLTVLGQGGSFVLLCFIVYWLTGWVPKRIERADLVREKEAEARVRVAEALQRTAEAQAQSYLVAHEKDLAAFAQQQQYEREACDRRHAELLEQQLKTHDLVREVRHEVAGIAHSRAMERAAQELKQKPPRGGVA